MSLLTFIGISLVVLGLVMLGVSAYYFSLGMQELYGKETEKKRAFKSQ